MYDCPLSDNQQLNLDGPLVATIDGSPLHQPRWRKSQWPAIILPLVDQHGLTGGITAVGHWRPNGVAPTYCHRWASSGPPVVYLCIAISVPTLGRRTKNWWLTGGFYQWANGVAAGGPLVGHQQIAILSIVTQLNIKCLNP